MAYKDYEEFAAAHRRQCYEQRQRREAWETECRELGLVNESDSVVTEQAWPRRNVTATQRLCLLLEDVRD
jgi:hypothetical protein